MPKIIQYCEYQERCHKEVKEKLHSYGLHKTDVEKLINELVEENYLDEKRFAIQYAGGKFRIRRWGRNKIMLALQEKQVGNHFIKQALQEINTSDYEKVLAALAVKKWDSLKAVPKRTREVKTRNYLLQKGFEPEIISRALSIFRTA